MEQILFIVANLISQIITNDKLVVLVANRNINDGLVPLLSRVVLIVPKTIAIVVIAAPDSVTDVVVQDHS